MISEDFASSATALLILFSFLCPHSFAYLSAAEAPKPISEFTRQFCTDCHGSKKQKGDFRIDTLPWNLTDSDSRRQWDLVREYVTDGDMPPKKAEQPAAKARQAFLNGVGDAYARADQSAKPGGTPLRRLNRVEYLNTIRDLFGIRMLNLPLSFPADATSAKFDTMPKGLFLSAAVMEGYHETAIDVANRLAPLPDQAQYRSDYDVLEIGGDEIRKWYGPPIKKLSGQFWKRQKEKDYLMFTGLGNSGWIGALWDPLFVAPASGVYRVRLLVNAQAETGADGKPLRLGFYAFDPKGKNLPKRYRRAWATQVADLEVPVLKPTWIECLVPIEEGEVFHTYLENRFAPGKYPDDQVQIGKTDITTWVRKAMLDPAPTVELGGMTIEGPVDVSPRVKDLFGFWPPSLNRAELESKLLPLASRAFRRPLTNVEKAKLIESFLEHGKKSGQPELAWHYAIRRILCSPAFLYREAENAETLSQFGLASRLSYFLWSSMPDRELIGLAAAGKLSNPKVLATQTRRLLKDPKSDQFVKHFTGQWLGNREVEAINVCDIRYQWDENVRYGFVRSTEEFFKEILRDDLPISTFVDSDFTYANRAMLAIWGVAGSGSLEKVAALQRHSQVWPEPKRIDLTNQKAKLPDHVLNRRGLLGLPGVHTVTGDGVESSPILRGVWVLENLFGHHPPPPPKDVPALDIDTSKATNVRETLKAHTEVETCAKCHRDIDPLGLALENYDAVGGWRTAYAGRNGTPIDPTATLPDGTQLSGPASIKQHLLTNPSIFTRCLLTKLLEYGAGRTLSVGDQRIVDELVKREPKSGYRFQDLIQAAVTSEVFPIRVSEHTLPRQRVRML
jgi:hypothetical protein